MWKRFCVLGLLIALSSVIVGAQVVEQPEVLTNEDVVKMVKAGLGDAAIAQKIVTSQLNFKLSVDDLIALRKAGVSEYLLQVMQGMAIAQAYGARVNLGQSGVPVPSSPNQPKINSWRGQILDQSTPAGAVAILGQPDEDKTGQSLGLLLLSSRFEMKPVCREKVFRVFTYKKLEGLDKAKLAYLDGKLVMVHLDLKEPLDPNKLEYEYGVQFAPTEEWVRLKNEEQYGARLSRGGGILGGVFSGMSNFYYLYTVPSESEFHAHVWAKAELRSGLRSLISLKKQLGYLPGWVTNIQLVSGTLESEATRRVLK